MTGGRISVHTEVVRQTLVARLVELVRDNAHERQRGNAREAHRAAGVELLDAIPGAAARRMALAGYELRAVERRLFQPARAATPGLARALELRMSRGMSRPQAIADVSRELAEAEPLDRADPGDQDAASWRVPGPGGHVRHYVAAELVNGGPKVLKRSVMYGFFVHCCVEALPEDAE